MDTQDLAQRALNNTLTATGLIAQGAIIYLAITWFFPTWAWVAVLFLFSHLATTNTTLRIKDPTTYGVTLLCDIFIITPLTVAGMYFVKLFLGV
jgi:hypothetical protein